MKTLLPLWLIVLSSLLAHAGADISGGASYQFGANNATVSFGCGQLRNTSSENATGTLMMKLWALDAPYEGGTIRGYTLGSYKLEPLAGGMYYNNLKKTVKCTLPPKRKSYYLCMTVAEYSNGGYATSDHANFSKTVVLGVPPKQFTMSGPWSWQVSDDFATVDLKVAKISHTRTANTGSLRLALWATRAPYQGGVINGYELGMVQKKALDPGYSYTSVQNRAKYKKPPPGTYHVTLLLLEFNGTEYVVKAWLPGSKTSTFN